MKKTLSIIGVGAFGEFMLRHVVPYFDTHVHDPHRDLADVTATYNVEACDLDRAARCDIVVIATPVRAMDGVVRQIKDTLRQGQLVIDVASVKTLPTGIMKDNLADDIEIVSLHPLFGPQSGKHGIRGLNIALMDIRGQSGRDVEIFLRRKLGLRVVICTPEEHDRQMAYVQGLTHMVARVFQMMEIPEITQETKTFSLLRQAVDIVKNDSDALFRAIQTDNPYVERTKEKFFTCVKQLEIDLKD